MNDLWRFDIDSLKWNLVAGDTTNSVAGIYTFPFKIGSREDFDMVLHPNNTLYVFGGYARDQGGNLGEINDLWEFNLNTLKWTFIGGNTTINVYGKYTFPYRIGARKAHKMVLHPNNSLIVFGGEGYDGGANYGIISKLKRK